MLQTMFSKLPWSNYRPIDDGLENDDFDKEMLQSQSQSSWQRFKNQKSYRVLIIVGVLLLLTACYFLLVSNDGDLEKKDQFFVPESRFYLD